ncbi:DUF4010 domain-containing protein, partial [Hoeflea sp. BAL378]|uniref:DUF4010 domain-containing protein n=1 Tax=Hoeflea sp. BAL378 TaxID=1547437 RepID=UPI00054DCDB7
FVSSLATIGAMAGRAGRDPTALDAAVAGAALSTVATYLQLAALLYVTSAETFLALAWPLAAGAVAAALYGLVFTLRALSSDEPADTEPGRAFSLTTALALAATMTLMLVGVAALKAWFGETGVVAGVALAGIVDAHSASISAASLVLSGQLQPHQAVVPILAALSTNALAKIVMAASAGSTAFALRTAPGIILSVAAVWLVVAVTGDAGLPPV